MGDAGRRDLAIALYERVTVTSEGIVEVELTQEALQHGAALALQERAVLARPEGSAPPTLRSEIAGTMRGRRLPAWKNQ
jgi:hypothetical protein